MAETTDTTPTSAGRAAAALAYLRTALGPLLALVVVVALFSVVDSVWYQGTFATRRNARTVAAQSCVVGIAALGMTLIIVSGGIDLSAGIAVALCATTVAYGIREDVGAVILYGANFAGQTRRLEYAQEQRSRAIKEQDQAQEEVWGARALHRREQLLRTCRHKLAGLERMAQGAGESYRKLEARPEPDSDEERSERRLALANAKRTQGEFQADVARMQRRIANLADETIDFKAGFADNRDWLSAIPNSPLTGPVAVVIGIVTGLLTGLVNGAPISTLRVAPFIVTLGTMMIFLGLGNLLSGNVPVRPAMNYQEPSWLSPLLNPSEKSLWLGFPLGVWLTLGLAGGLALVLRYTVFGRHVFALGSNEATARLCGINVSGTKIALYALAGFFVGVAGILQCSRQMTGDPTAGTGLELKIIAAVVVGGASLSGGRGTVLGTLAGVAIMSVIDSGCAQVGLTDQTQKIVLGAIIIGAVVLDQLRQRRVV